MENISVFDLVVTVLLATATFWGGLRGVVSQISAIATWILSGLAAARYGSVVGEMVSIPEPWRAPVSALIVFCAALLALSVATRFVKRAVSLAGLKEFDRQAGALFGFFKGIAICVVLTFFCVLGAEKTRDLVDNSKSGPYLASVSLLLKGAFPESETMTRFETLVATMASSQAKRGETPTLNSEIADLETYLKDNVLSPEAANVVEEAESGAAASNGGSSGWSRFWDDLREWNGGRKADETVVNDANVANDANGYWNDANGYWSDARNGSFGGDESRETEENNGGWGSWDVWEGRGEGDVRNGSTNGGYYGEYEENVENGGGRDWSDYAAYNGGSGSEYAETSSGWSEFATFLTNITGGTRSTRGTNGAASASNERQTANYVAPSSESLNEYLGVPTNRSASSGETTTFDVSAPRTTDGAILGRPSATSTPLIPPLPY